MFDYHIHTSYSDDSNSDMEDMILSAIDKGFQEIAITDHIDLEYPDTNIPFTLDFHAYHSALERCQEKYKSRIKIVRGIEVGMQETVTEGNCDIVRSYPYDFVIGSMHAAENKDLYTGMYYEGKTPLQCFRDFYSYTYKCLKAFKDYNVLGHLNIVARYYPRFVSQAPPPQEEYLDLVEDILRLVVEDGKGIEFNTSCYRYNNGLTYPSPEMLAMYKKLNGEIITIGSDAHVPEHVGFGFKDALDLLESLGFKYLATYGRMEPKMTKISDFW
jgi:histidinol-phosphatase (PHP family)